MKVLDTKKPIVHQVQHYQNLNGEDVCTVNTTLPIFIDGNIAGAVEIARITLQFKNLLTQLLTYSRK